MLLLVEDNDALLRHTSCLLKSAIPDVDVVAVHTAREARQAAAARSLRVIVADRRLPDADGLELIAEFKRGHPEALCILMTGESARTLRYADGRCVDVVLAKPFELEELLALVSEGLGRPVVPRRARRRRARPPASGHEASPSDEKPTPGQEQRSTGTRAEAVVQLSPRARHELLNGLGRVLVWARAFEADLRAIGDPAVTQLANEYIDTLLRTVNEVSDMVKGAESHAPE